MKGNLIIIWSTILMYIVSKYIENIYQQYAAIFLFGVTPLVFIYLNTIGYKGDIDDESGLPNGYILSYECSHKPARVEYKNGVYSVDFGNAIVTIRPNKETTIKIIKRRDDFWVGVNFGDEKILRYPPDEDENLSESQP